MARTSKLAVPDFAKAVAEAYVNGMSRDDMAAEFSVHPDTITIWCRDPRVQAPAARIAQDRVTRILRKIDAEMEGRLAHLDKMDIEQILKVRKEYLGNAIKIDLGSAGQAAETINEVAAAVQDRPELAVALREALEASGSN